MIETERLRIYPATLSQMEAAIASETDEELKKAYQEMLDGCLQNPHLWEWYAMWMIELKDGTHIGDLCFKGLDLNGVTEVGYGILEKYQGQGYATETVKAVVSWAFDNPMVAAIEAETDPGNKASQRVLEKCGFVPNGQTGKEGPRFTIVREK
ncbi:MAG: GNAT family N-acetyltransferase [Coriobacteriales bacterium]|nr:GNAT family N-acetyltransferase [Coriobacteriales bacterium]